MPRDCLAVVHFLLLVFYVFCSRSGTKVFFGLVPLDLKESIRSIYFQNDLVTVNLGQVVNAGFSKKWGGNKPEHNTLSIKVSWTKNILAVELSPQQL